MLLAVCQLCREDQAFSEQLPFFQEGNFCSFAYQSFPTESSKGKHQAKVNISVLFSGCLSKNQDSPKASPKAIFQRKNMTEQLILVLTAEKAEYAEYAEFSVPKCQHVATLQFVSCAKRDQAFAEQHPFFHEDNLDKFAYQTFPRKQTQVNISIFL